MLYEPLDVGFYEMPTLAMAQALLGKLLVHETAEGMASGWIVETEAYRGPEDRAAHSFGNRRTRRTEVMFGPAGHAYTHVMHTHCLINVVSGAIGEPEGVLLRAVEPCDGIELMYKRRGIEKKETELTSGPGKLTQALGITMDYYARSLMKPPLYIADGKTPQSISRGPRIGIPNSGEAKHYPWRFWIEGNRFVSR